MPLLLIFLSGRRLLRLLGRRLLLRLTTGLQCLTRGFVLDVLFGQLLFCINRFCLGYILGLLGLGFRRGLGGLLGSPSLLSWARSWMTISSTGSVCGAQEWTKAQPPGPLGGFQRQCQG